MKYKVLLTICVIVWLSRLSVAHAHGGDYIISEARGRYFVVASLSPAPATVGRNDLSIAVRDATSYTPLPVEAVSVQLIRANEPPIVYSVPSEGAAADAIYGSHVIDFTQSGEWRVVITLQNGAETNDFEAVVQVAGSALRWLNVAIYMLPLGVLFGLIGLAALRNRHLRRAELQTESHVAE